MRTSSLPPLPHFSRSGLVLTLKIATILVASLAIFYQDLTIVAVDALQSEFMSYILAIPFILIYVIYRKRKMTRAAITFEPEKSKESFGRPEIFGALLFLIAFFLYSYGSYTFTPLEYHMAALPIFVAACILILFNTQTLRQLAFPIILLFLLVPPPTETIYALGATFSEIGSGVSCAILNLFGFGARISTVYGNPAIIIVQPNGTPLSFMVDIACSGIYSLIGFFIFALFIVYIVRGEKWKKAIMFLIGFPLMFLLNILRITIIVVLGYYYGMEIAMNVFHLLGGWILILLGTLLLLVVSEKILKIQLFRKKNINTCSECNPTPQSQQNFCQTCGRLLRQLDVKLGKKDLFKISAIVISVILILSIQAPVFASAKSPVDVLTQISAGQQPTTDILPQMNEHTLKFLFRDEAFENQSKQDAALTYAYFPSNESLDTIYAGLEIASAKSSLHRWELCLIEYAIQHGREPRVVQLDLRDVKIIENPPITARYFAFQYKKSNLTQVVLYWYEIATFSTNSTSQQKYVKISMIAYPEEAEDLQQVEDQLLVFATAIASYWHPLKTWSQITLFISQNAQYLTIIPTATLALVITLHLAAGKREKKANKKSFTKLAMQDQQVLEAISKTQRKTVSTVNNVQSTYQRLTGKSIEKQELTQRLDTLKTLGFVKEEIANRQDEPILVWKSQI
mgnify:CR=1 FL=1